jgi:hypothetical protein
MRGPRRRRLVLLTPCRSPGATNSARRCRPCDHCRCGASPGWGYEKSGGTTPCTSGYRELPLQRVRSHGPGMLFGLVQLSQNHARLADHFRQITSPSDSFCCVMPMPERILIADGSSASGGSSMHSTAPFSTHRWRSAWTPAPGPSTATGFPAHRKFLGVHQLFPRTFCYLPRPNVRLRRWPDRRH